MKRGFDLPWANTRLVVDEWRGYVIGEGWIKARWTIGTRRNKMGTSQYLRGLCNEISMENRYLCGNH